jgi:hypothetical protein
VQPVDEDHADHLARMLRGARSPSALPLARGQGSEGNESGCDAAASGLRQPAAGSARSARLTQHLREPLLPLSCLVLPIAALGRIVLGSPATSWARQDGARARRDQGERKRQTSHGAIFSARGRAKLPR